MFPTSAAVNISREPAMTNTLADVRTSLLIASLLLQFHHQVTVTDWSYRHISAILCNNVNQMSANYKYSSS